MNTLLASSLALMALVIFLLLWKSIDWFDELINN